ncbi:bromodomain adjacent to zinc finger domain 2a [Anaeramoeba flamelloides]|uniref:Bromodomain adjacent to zinc finger domain 2a n=1 Tax=Anaeramoeba flamelloides TaxID=1746091 RepID=A0AAV7ZKW9_9EUKA|nr:bromodomain adjacent to zinc finger domain 2a [Anaeramoeba flamelloides]
MNDPFCNFCLSSNAHKTLKGIRINKKNSRGTSVVPYSEMYLCEECFKETNNQKVKIKKRKFSFSIANFKIQDKQYNLTSSEMASLGLAYSNIQQSQNLKNGNPLHKKNRITRKRKEKKLHRRKIKEIEKKKRNKSHEPSTVNPISHSFSTRNKKKTSNKFTSQTINEEIDHSPSPTRNKKKKKELVEEAEVEEDLEKQKRRKEEEKMVKNPNINQKKNPNIVQNNNKKKESKLNMKLLVNLDQNENHVSLQNENETQNKKENQNKNETQNKKANQEHKTIMKKNKKVKSNNNNNNNNNHDSEIIKNLFQTFLAIEKLFKDNNLLKSVYKYLKTILKLKNDIFKQFELINLQTYHLIQQFEKNIQDVKTKQFIALLKEKPIYGQLSNLLSIVKLYHLISNDDINKVFKVLKNFQVLSDSSIVNIRDEVDDLKKKNKSRTFNLNLKLKKVKKFKKYMVEEIYLQNELRNSFGFVDPKLQKKLNLQIEMENKSLSEKKIRKKRKWRKDEGKRSPNQDKNTILFKNQTQNKSIREKIYDDDDDDDDEYEYDYNDDEDEDDEDYIDGGGNNEAIINQDFFSDQDMDVGLNSFSDIEQQNENDTKKMKKKNEKKRKRKRKKNDRMLLSKMIFQEIKTEKGIDIGERKRKSFYQDGNMNKTNYQSKKKKINQNQIQKTVGANNINYNDINKELIMNSIIRRRRKKKKKKKRKEKKREKRERKKKKKQNERRKKNKLKQNGDSVLNMIDPLQLSKNKKIKKLRIQKIQKDDINQKSNCLVNGNSIILDDKQNSNLNQKIALSSTFPNFYESTELEIIDGWSTQTAVGERIDHKTANTDSNNNNEMVNKHVTDELNWETTEKNNTDKSWEIVNNVYQESQTKLIRIPLKSNNKK